MIDSDGIIPLLGYELAEDRGWDPDQREKFLDIMYEKHSRAMDRLIESAIEEVER